MPRPAQRPPPPPNSAAAIAAAAVVLPMPISPRHNHGVTARGVSAYPAAVTAQMVANFSAGGAAINQLARTVGANLHVVPLALEQPTADFTQALAMNEDAFLAAVGTGYEAVSSGADLVCLGEMGIGNTTAAAAIANMRFATAKRIICSE